MITKHWPVNVNTVRGHTPSALSWTAFEFKHEQRWLWSLHPLPLLKKGKQSHKCRHRELVTLFKVVPSSSCNKEFRLIAGRAWPSIMMLAPKLTTCTSQFTYYSQNHCYDYNHALIILHHYIIYATYTVCGLCVCAFEYTPILLSSFAHAKIHNSANLLPCCFHCPSGVTHTDMMIVELTVKFSTRCVHDLHSCSISFLIWVFTLESWTPWQP